MSPSLEPGRNWSSLDLAAPFKLNLFWRSSSHSWTVRDGSCGYHPMRIHYILLLHPRRRRPKNGLSSTSLGTIAHQRAHKHLPGIARNRGEAALTKESSKVDQFCGTYSMTRREYTHGQHTRCILSHTIFAIAIDSF